MKKLDFETNKKYSSKLELFFRDHQSMPEELESR
jgi:hypothetical protein